MELFFIRGAWRAFGSSGTPTETHLQGGTDGLQETPHKFVMDGPALSTGVSRSNLLPAENHQYGSNKTSTLIQTADLDQMKKFYMDFFPGNFVKQEAERYVFSDVSNDQIVLEGYRNYKGPGDAAFLGKAIVELEYPDPDLLIKAFALRQDQGIRPIVMENSRNSIKMHYLDPDDNSVIVMTNFKSEVDAIRAWVDIRNHPSITANR